ncbi:hypothetical protein [Aeropyrum camini]|uniref:Uncharacterized protein n=1 Tax=Aeropyrum camini SY1 = JCM 12091 TaxID=1198449 RepID=U3TFD2_9CREN|nr:hypothetical protein [Aeropyrum camini]BAN90683.1 hypothetical protein ACAM_1214 [Aeropyrum camini SY1 = JCM 12091]
MTSAYSFVEGWIVEAPGSPAEYWIVKGYEHPPGKVVAAPYRRGGKRLDPRSIEQAPLWTIEHFPCRGGPVPMLSLDAASSKPVNPWRVLELRYPDLPHPIKHLLEEVNPELAGLTGSWAVFAEDRGSDVDLIVYGDPDEIYLALKYLKSRGAIVRHKHKRSEYPLDSARLLDSCIKNGGETACYTLRILRYTTPRECSKRLTPLGLYAGPLEITGEQEALDSILVPARYRAVLLKLGLPAVVETWRTSYQELKPGVYAGVLEVFADQNGAITASPDLKGHLKPMASAW